MSKVDKDSRLQVMRGIAIVLVLVWHSISQVNRNSVLNGLGQIIICFHMPIFFVIAGFLFEKGLAKYLKNGRMVFLKKKAKHLLMPYVFWTVLLWAGVNGALFVMPSTVNKLSLLGFPPMTVIEMLWGILTYENYYTQHLWFLYVLFAFFVINIFLPKKGKSWTVFVLWVGIGFVSVCVDLPNILERIMLWGCFFCIGRIVCEKPLILQRISGGRVAFLFICISVLRLLSYSVSGSMMIRLGVQIIKYAEGFLGVCVIYSLAKLLENNVFLNLKTIGDYSYDIYLMHNPYIVALTSIILNKGLRINSYITIVAAVSMGIALPICASRHAIRNIPFLAEVLLGIEREK